jgi:exonuclease III
MAKLIPEDCNSKNALKIFHQNIRGLNSDKIEELTLALAMDFMHIICLTEHHMRDSIIDTFILPHYNLGTKFCRKKLKNGGVCIFIHESIQFSNINMEKFCKDKDLEICAVRLHLAHYEICIITIYRSPSGDLQYFIDNMEEALNMIYRNTIEIIICGDFNINYQKDTQEKMLLDSLLASYGMYSVVLFPTRIQNKCSSQIDNIFINTTKFKEFSVYPIINGLSDHDAQGLSLHKLINSRKNERDNHFSYKRKIDSNSIKDFNIKLSYESWKEVLDEEDVDRMFNNFLNTYIRLFYSSFPLKKNYYKFCNKAWVTRGIRISCINKKKIFSSLRYSNDPNLLNYYKNYCKILTNVIKIAKKNYYNRVLDHSNNKVKTAWNIIKSTSNIKPKAQNITSIKIDKKLSFEGQIIAETFNKYFVSAAQHNLTKNSNMSSSSENPILYLRRAFNQPFPSIKLKRVSSEEIEDITKLLKIKNSHGYDGISTKILKSSIAYVSSPITYICNRMLITGTFPSRLKFSEVRPIYKKGDGKDVSNYRPISLLTSFSKIFEKVVYNRLHKHIECNHILAAEQFGFRHKSSTDMATYHLTDNILTALNNKAYVGSIFCDLQKAFDSVNYDVLLAKMEFYGISGKAHKLIESYLKNRYQRVLIDLDSKKYYSEWKLVTDGVPQGSILGPLLFLLYINDLPFLMSNISHPILYADDTSLVLKNSDSQIFKENVITSVRQISKWFQSNLLVLNLEKTNFLQFETTNLNVMKFPVVYENKQISNVQSIRFLGVIIDNKLSWQCHVDHMIPKLNKVVYLIRVLKSFLTFESLKMMYFTLFHSIIAYGIIFWGVSSHSKKIFKIQKRVLRIMANVDRRSSCRTIFKKVNILPLQSQYIYSTLMFIVKNKELFKINSEFHTLNTRTKHDLHMPAAKLTIYQRGTCYSGIKMFNHLPQTLKQVSNNIPKFRTSLKRLLIENSFYSIEEFYSWKQT